MKQVFGGLFLFFLTGILALLFGTTDLTEMKWETFWQIRGIRVALAAIAGAALAVAGTLMQGLFRNPLASPSIAGVNAGGIFGGQIALIGYITFSKYLPKAIHEEMFLPLGVFCGAGFVLMILLLFLKWLKSDADDLLMILLIGLMLSNFFSALTGIVTLVALDDWALNRSVLAFSYGQLDGKGLNHLLLSLPLFFGGFLAALRWSHPLDLLLSGEEEAISLGVPLRQTRRWVLIWTSVLVTAAVAVGGGVAFVGLVVPHFMRLFTGPNHRKLIPASALGGAIFLMLCDLISRLPCFVSELPLGSVTAIFGAPLFLYLFLRDRQQLL